MTMSGNYRSKRRPACLAPSARAPACWPTLTRPLYVGIHISSVAASVHMTTAMMASSTRQAAGRWNSGVR